MKNLLNAFISYGRGDSKGFATKLHARLVEQGLKVWFDQNDIPLGVDFQNQIDDGINHSHNFLFIIAPHSVNSPYCRKEIELAIKRNKRIIPLLHVEQISWETWQQRNPKGTTEDWEAYKAQGLHTCYQNIHPTISKINWVYFREGIDDFETAFTGLVSLLGRQADYVEQHTQFLVQALEWERHQKQTSYLLIGEEKQQAEAWLKVRFKDEQPPCLPTDLHCEFITESIKNANNLMTQVFLSYAESDRTTMEKIRNSLRRESITVWTNKTDIETGEAFEQAVKRGIEQADNVVYLLSPDAVISDFCQRELDYALSLHKRIIPVWVRETNPMLVTPALRSLQYIDLTDNVQEEDYCLDESQLLRILHQDAAYYNEHKVLLVKALKWKRQYDNPSILLRGYNLRHAQTWLKVARARIQHPPTALQEEFITESLRQPPASSLDVFISYSRADSDLARKLNDALQIQGKTTWFDQESIASGTDFQQEICQGIKACDNFLFILSPRSVNSPYCADEVEYAASLNKRFVTVLHREVEDLHPELAKVQWIDFNHNEKDFKANFLQLVRTLDTDREHVHSHTKWLQRAIEWQEKARSADLLLRGNECAIAQQWLLEAEQKNKQPAATPLQKALIESSKNAIVAAQEEEKGRQAEMLRLQEERAKEAEARLAAQKKSARLQKFFLVRVSVALVVVSVLAVVAFLQSQKAANSELKATVTHSQSLFALDQRFDALIEAIRAKRNLEKLSRVEAKTQDQVESALRQAVYGVAEYNRFSGHSDAIYAFALSPDSQMIASASWDRTVKLWKIDGTLLKILTGYNDEVDAVAFSPDGQLIASASKDGIIKLWHRNGTLFKSFRGHEDEIDGLAFSPDGKLIASASKDTTIKLWKIDGTLLNTLERHSKQVWGVAFSPNGQMIASGSWDNTINLWKSDGTFLKTLKGHSKEVYGVAFSPDGQLIASASKDRTIKLWHRDGTLFKTIEGHSDKVYDVAFSRSGKLIASASQDKTIKLWNRDGTLVKTLSGHSDRVDRVAFSRDGKLVASGSWDRTIRLWKIDRMLLKTIPGHSDVVWAVAFSPDGKLIASASWDNTVKLWNRDGTLLKSLTGHKDAVDGVAFSPDGKLIASASRDKTVRLWNTDGTLLRKLEGHSAAVEGVAFSPDGQMIASASRDKTIKLWNRDGILLKTLNGHKALVWGVDFSPDGKLIASASEDKTVNLWKIDGTLFKTLTDHQDVVNEVVFSPDSQLIASASRDKTINLWNRNGTLLKTLVGHSDEVGGVAFSPDGKLIASASKDKTVKLWNRDGTLYKTLAGHSKEVNGVAFSPDGKLLVSGSQDHMVMLWNLDRVLDVDQLLAYGCKWVHDYLKNNSEVGKSDRHLCDNINTHK
ncbi:MAG TPA: TIR domain-containing protein [Waterburya sp.]|jgi:WD40 repeat protein